METWMVASAVTGLTVFIVGVYLARRRAREEREARDRRRRETLH